MTRRSSSTAFPYLLLLGLVLGAGCSDGPNQPATPENSAPTIVSCAAEPATVAVGTDATLTVDAEDDDGDDLTYTWSADSGQFPAGTDGESVTWTPPAQMGTYTVTVTVDDGTDTATDTIQIEVTVPQNSAPTIVSCNADPATIAVGTSTTLTVDAVDDDGDDLTYTWSADTGQFPSGTDGESVTWTPPAQMGTYTVTVTVDDGADTTEDTIQIVVTVPEVTVAPAALDFGDATTALSFTVTNTGDGVLAWSANDDRDWISVAPDGGDVAAGLYDEATVTVDRTGLAPGSHDGAVTVTTPYGDSNVAISLTVPTPPALAVSPESLDFGAVTVELAFEIANTGESELTWTVEGSANWLEVDPDAGDTSAETDVVTVTADRSGLAPGAHQATVNIYSNGGQASIGVDLLVSIPPALTVSRESLEFGLSTDELPFGITNTGQGELTWTITGSTSWIQVAPAAGDTRDETDIVVVTIDRSGLAQGDYEGTVDIVSNGGEASIAVTMSVPPAAPPAVGLSPLTLDFGSTATDRDLNVTNAGGGTLSWTASTAASFLTLAPDAGETTTETDVITVTLDRTGLLPGQHTGYVTVHGNDTNETATINFTVPEQTPTLTNLFFLHHSTGRNLISDGSVRAHLASRSAALDFWDHDYNYGAPCGSYNGLRNPSGGYEGYDYDIPGNNACGNTDPDGLHYLWTTANSARSTILANHEVIAFKSCYPASAITSDSLLNQYKQWYLAMGAVFDQYPDKVFVVMSQPPLRRSRTNTTEADRARNFANWLGEEFVVDHANVVFFDFFDHLAHPDDGSADRNMLRTAYERPYDTTDSHPNDLANQTVGPFFADALADAAGGAR